MNPMSLYLILAPSRTRTSIGNIQNLLHCSIIFKSPLKKRQPEVRQDILAACLGRISTVHRSLRNFRTSRRHDWIDIQAEKSVKKRVCEKFRRFTCRVHRMNVFLLQLHTHSFVAYCHSSIFPVFLFLANKPHSSATEEHKYV
jgi:hypothetical protein